jgi:hypothetical protein
MLATGQPEWLPYKSLGIDEVPELTLDGFPTMRLRFVVFNPPIAISSSKS